MGVVTNDLVTAALAWRDLLADSWVGRKPHRAKGEHCLATAAGVTIGNHVYGEWCMEWDYFLSERAGIKLELTAYNDAPGRTKQEVLDLVDDFARWLKEREG